MGIVLLMWLGTISYGMMESGYYLTQHKKLSTMGALLGKAPQAAAIFDSGPQLTTGGAGGGGAVLAYAQQALGTPYKWGAPAQCTPTPTAYDCSGLVRCAVLAATNNIVDLGHYTVAQLAALKKARWTLPRSQWHPATLQPGDLIFYYIKSDAPTEPGHVAIYAGGGRVIDAPHAGTVVRYDRWNLGPIMGVGRIKAAPVKAAA